MPDRQDTTLTSQEMRAQMAFIFRASLAANDDDRHAALIDGLMAFGPRFVWLCRLTADETPDDPRFERLTDDAAALLIRWMKGEKLTSRADEAERRAQAAAILLDTPGKEDLVDYAARAILVLPEGHPLRDVAKARAGVRRQLAAYQVAAEPPWDSAAFMLAMAYEERFGTDEELMDWESWVETIAPHLDPDTARRLWGAVSGFYLALTHETGETQWRQRAARANARIDASRLSDEERVVHELNLALAAIVDDDQLAAAEEFKKALASGHLGPRLQRQIAVQEARVRLANDQRERVVALLATRLDDYEQEYVTSINAKDRETAGDEFCEACTNLAYAYAGTALWEQAVEALERGKCARQRYTRALRRTPTAARLLEVEGSLYALARGLQVDGLAPTVERVKDWLAQGLSPEAQLQEQYRRVLPTLAYEDWRTPRFADIQRELRDGEAALSLGISAFGLMAAVVVRDQTSCLHTALQPDVTDSLLASYLVGPNDRDEDGFLLELDQASDEASTRQALSRLLQLLDGVLGQPVAQVLRDHGIGRLVVIPHQFLRLTPLWALASWADLDVRMATDASSLLKGQPAPAMTRTALVVTNPTLDLAMTATEGAITVARLKDARFDVRSLDGGEATEDAVVGKLPGVGLLHFAGHGHASLTDGSLSALLLSPEWSRAGLKGAEELVRLANEAPETPHLVVEQDDGNPHRSIHYEYAQKGTLFVDAMQNDVAIAGELWRAGDILVGGQLEDCTLAFLCACSSGLGAVSQLDEATGLAAALDLAGVRSVVCTGWPVPDALALLFADEFYARALSPNTPTVDLVAAVRQAAAVLRSLHRIDAAERVDRLAGRAADASARFRLRSYAKRLRAGIERPFEHPFDWGAFFLTGAAEVELRR